MESAEVNWLAVVLAALIPVVVGALWYSPMLFAQTWMTAVGRSHEDVTGARVGYAISAIGSLVTAAVLAYVVDWAGADGLLEGAFTGFLAWLGFVAPVVAVSTYFGGRPRALWAIDASYHLVSLALMGALLALWD
jgi:hypothetical protein